MPDIGDDLGSTSAGLEARWAPRGVLDLDDPSREVLDKLEGLGLTDQDLEELLGESPGFSAIDLRNSVQRFWFRLRSRLSALICQDARLSAAVATAMSAGSASLLPLLITTLGLDPASAAAHAIEPMAVGITFGGLEKLCN